MRPPRGRSRGNAGESRVTAEFQILGWGVSDNYRDDVGTDLLLMARDADETDLGLLVGAQVKTEKKPFASPVLGEAGIKGFWWRDRDSEHTDAWIAHNVPHILILHDLEANESYWEQITKDTVVSTGKGVKIFVPSGHRIDDASRKDLLQVAASGRVVSWEGTAWRKVEQLSTDDWLRYALLTPRLVAPHANAGQPEKLTPEQAIALLAEARIRELGQLGSDESLRAEPKAWRWQFFDALEAYLLRDSTDELIAVCETAPTPDDRAAATAVTAACLIQSGATDSAVELIEPALARGDASDVNTAWLRIQLARAFADVGRTTEARANAVEVYGMRAERPHDATAGALSGVAAILLFNTSDWGEQDVAQVVAAADTAALWWVTESAFPGLTAAAQKVFEAAVRHRTRTFGGDDPDVNKLGSAAFISGCMGDQSGWAQMTRLTAKRLLSRGSGRIRVEDARHALGLMRLAGDEKAISLAARALIEDGPAIAVQEAAKDVQLAKATRTTAPADLALLEAAGDVLDQSTATAAVDWILETLEDPAAFIRRTAPSYLLGMRLAEVLDGVLVAADHTARATIAEYVVKLPSGLNELETRAWAKVVDDLSAAAWSEACRSSAGNSAKRHQDPLRSELLAVASGSDAEARRELEADVRSGSVTALAAFGDVRDLDETDAQAAIEAAATRVQANIAEAQQGRYVFNSSDFAADLALLNAWHGDHADWPTLLSFLDDETVLVQHKAGAFSTLASLQDRLEGKLRQDLGVIAQRLADAEPATLYSPFDPASDAWGASAVFAATAGIASQEQTDERLTRLLDGDVDHRQWAARLAYARGGDVAAGVLAVLARDCNPRVRSAAAGVSAYLVATGKAGDLTTRTVEASLRDPGVLVPRTAARELASKSAANPIAKELLRSLGWHISESVRQLIVQCDLPETPQS